MCNSGFTASGNNCVSPMPTGPFSYFFLTDTAWMGGDLGGLSGADAKCQAQASSAGLAGTYKAWLSGATTSAYDRLTHNAGPYVLVDGTKVADDWADFTDGSFDNPLNKTAAGSTVVSAGTYVWTGSTSAGINNNNTTHCTTTMFGEGWDSHLHTGTATAVGSSSPSTVAVYYQIDCPYSNKLYCLEQ